MPSQGVNPSAILVGVAASGRSEDAIAFARRLAGASSAHVIVGGAFADCDVPGRVSSTAHRALLREAVRGLSVAPDGIAAERVGFRVARNSSPAAALNDLATSERAQIIIVGSSHTSRWGRVTPGSTGERLLRGAPCAVAVVPHGYSTRGDESIRRIGVAYDASEEAISAVTAAIEFARAFGAELELIRVIDPTSRRAQDPFGSALVDLPEDVSATGLRLAGDPAEQLGKHSADLDLMIAGSRGYGPLRSVIAGGVSGRLMRTARCPVIIVPPATGEPLGALFANAPAIAT